MIRVAFVVGEYPSEEGRLREDVAKSYSNAEVEVGIVHAPTSPYGGLGPAEIQLVAPYFHSAFLEAEQQGYNAVVPLGMLDLGIDGGRSLVDIPVIGPCEATFHIAAQLGDRFGVVCYHERTMPRQITMTRMYGMDAWIGGRRAVGLHLREMADNKELLRENLVAACKDLTEKDGADVLIMHGISLCPVHVDPHWLEAQVGVPIVEGIGAPIRMAALLAGLGLKHSRKRWPKSDARPKL